LDFFENSCVIFQVFAVQEEGKTDTRLFKMTTRVNRNEIEDEIIWFFFSSKLGFEKDRTKAR